METEQHISTSSSLEEVEVEETNNINNNNINKEIYQQLPVNPIELFTQIQTPILDQYTSIVLPSLQQSKQSNKQIISQKAELSIMPSKKKIDSSEDCD